VGECDVGSPGSGGASPYPPRASRFNPENVTRRNCRSTLAIGKFCRIRDARRSVTGKKLGRPMVGTVEKKKDIFVSGW
jgi:hypothetical protein